MTDLPIEIWQIIIEYAYDLHYGWHCGVFKLCLASRTYNELVKYLFQKFINKPVFLKQDAAFLSMKEIIKFMTKDLPKLVDGYLIEDEYSRNVDFSLINFITDENFFHKYKNERCFVAYSYFRKNKKGDCLQIKLSDPIIIAPFTYYKPTGLLTQGVYLIGNNIHTKFAAHTDDGILIQTVTNMDISKINYSFHKYVNYIVNTNNVISTDPMELNNSALQI